MLYFIKGYLNGKRALVFALLGLLLVLFFVVALQRYQQRLLSIVLTSQQIELAKASEQLVADLAARSADLNLLTNVPELALLSDDTGSASGLILQ